MNHDSSSIVSGLTCIKFTIGVDGGTRMNSVLEAKVRKEFQERSEYRHQNNKWGKAFYG